jgi:hypothetical protein
MKKFNLTIDESHVIFLNVDFGIRNAELKSFIRFKNMFHSGIPACRQAGAFCIPQLIIEEVKDDETQRCDATRYDTVSEWKVGIR